MKPFLVPFVTTAAIGCFGASPGWCEEGPVPLVPAPKAPQAAVPHVTAPGENVRVTSESSEYCAQLQDRVDNMMRDSKTPEAEEAASLSQEGERLCKHGKTRSGILHLRRAFILIRPREEGQ